MGLSVDCSPNKEVKRLNSSHLTLIGAILTLNLEVLGLFLLRKFNRNFIALILKRIK